MKDRLTDYRASIVCVTLLLIAAVVIAEPGLSQQSSSIVDGVIYDADSGKPIPYATVQVINSDRSTLANDEGKYRVILQPGETQLRFSHIAYFSQILDLAADTAGVTQDIYLKTCMADLGVMKVYSRQYDPGQQIIVEAIRRKKDILARIHDYRCDAYTRFLAYDESKRDSSRIWLIAETQVTTFWEQPNNYKEVITSRRQSANIKAENNLVTVGEILNFNKNRIDLGRYSVVSPTATDALDHYNYYLLDTLYIDSRAIFRLEIEPKNPDEPLFVGYINIADSTYDVVQVDVGFSRGVELPLIDSLRYSQRFAQFQNEYWMPVEIRLEGQIEFDVRLPGIPKKIRFEHVASLYSYEFESGHPKSTFDEYAIEVDRLADRFDSVTWNARQTIPLTRDETDAYRRIDSLENRPKSPGRVALMSVGAAAALVLVGNEDIFRFNRVEGPFLGLGFETDKLHERLKLRLKTGYAFDAKRSEHQIGMTWRLQEAQRFDFGLDYYNRVFGRTTITLPPNYNSTFWALINRWDPRDYYRAEGFQTFLSSKLLTHTMLKVAYSDFRYSSLLTRTTFGFFGDKADISPNPSVVDGTMRSVALDFVFDSRHMFKNKGRDTKIDEAEVTVAAAGVEYVSPRFIDNQFDFRKYYFDVHTRHRTLGLGMTSFRLYAGASEGNLPSQKYFTVDYGSGYLFSTGAFTTLGLKDCSGNRALVIQVNHDFRRTLFVASGLPGVRDLPFWLSVHGGIFWTEFRNHPYQLGDEHTLTAKSPYREIGFGLGNLTPFLAPFNMACYFTWQLSDYETSAFNIGLGIDL
ncbi:MAG: DUF5686 family protein [candidate division Zixibacteria bacterium]|nr:DUF5686 family protein [candidate division Zixibacteria bacterium]